MHAADILYATFTNQCWLDDTDLRRCLVWRVLTTASRTRSEGAWWTNRRWRARGEVWTNSVVVAVSGVYFTHTLSVEVHVFTITTHCPPLATELSRSLVLVCGMACRCMSPLRHRWQSYKAVSKHTCLGAPSHNIPLVKSPCSDIRHFEHYNRFCYLLVTY